MLPHALEARGARQVRRDRRVQAGSRIPNGLHPSVSPDLQRRPRVNSGRRSSAFTPWTSAFSVLVLSALAAN